MKYLRAILPLFAFFIYGSAKAAVPINDDFDNATAIDGANFVLTGNITGATIETWDIISGFILTEDYVSYWGGGNSVWYKWTAPIDGSTTLTIQSEFTPILDVYDATGVTNISDLSYPPLAYNKVSFVNGTDGTTTFTVTGGNAYYIRVASFTGEANNGIGSFAMTFQESGVAFGDNFSARTPIYGNSISVNGDNIAATAETGEPLHGGKTASKSVWLQWTALGHGSVTISTAGSNFDTVLSVYKSAIASPTFGDLTSVAQNDNETFLKKTSEVTFTADVGVTYYIAVDGTSANQSGSIKLGLDFHSTPPSITSKPGNQIVYQGLTATFNVTAAGTGTLTYQWQRLAAGTTTWSNVVNGTVIDGSATDLGVVYGGSTTNTLTIATTLNDAVPTNNDAFRCIVTDSIGSTISSVAKLTVTVLDTVQITIRGDLGSAIDLTTGGYTGDTYYAKGLPKGLTLDPLTGQITGTVTSKPGAYTVTYWTQTGSVKSAPLSLVINVSPLDSGLSGGFETILLDPITSIPVGKVELSVNATSGAFTGRLTCEDAKTYSLKGIIALNPAYTQGSVSLAINRGKILDPYDLEFTIDETLAPNQVLLATLKQSSTTIGQSSTGAQLATYSANSPAPWQGNYTLVFDDPTNPPFDLGTETPPNGTGFGLVTIKDVQGLLVFKGVLGDGTKLTASLAPSADGSYRWYGKPYKNGGFFGGWLGFELISGVYQMAGVSDSELYWAKTATSSKDKSYRAGFGPLMITATAQLWVAPANGTPLSTSLQLTSPVGQFNSAFTSTDLPPADNLVVPTVLTLGAQNQILVTTPTSNDDRFTAKVNTANGSFTASLILNDGRKVPISGVLIQQPTVNSGTVIGEGLFLIPPSIKGDETVSGRIQFKAP
ncbi:MAG TPA: putative Ig domain-containing protein [Rariglobus sp.]|jgi:hypothetical protein|nr:putative Ig domain-containing protein [Rariglobus sp.]